MVACLTLITQTTMESPLPSSQKPQETTTNDNQDTSFDEYYDQLPKDTSLGIELVQHQGFWCMTNFLKSTISFQTHFEARNTDLIISGMPKTGNTWLKSLVYATVNRDHQPVSESPLLHHNPHELVRILEIDTYSDDNPMHDHGPQTLLASTHLPYDALPQSMKDTDCRIIYICRNPLDAFVSSWFFYKELVKNKYNVDQFPSIEEYFELYLRGVTFFGPFFEHVLGYSKKSIEMPNKVLFVVYEELLKDTTSQLKRIAEFIGYPFGSIEEEDGIIGDIINLCSIKSLKERNKEGHYLHVDKHLYFRKGEIGDWANHMTPLMVNRMQELVNKMFNDLDLSIKQKLGFMI